MEAASVQVVGDVTKAWRVDLLAHAREPLAARGPVHRRPSRGAAAPCRGAEDRHRAGRHLASSLISEQGLASVGICTCSPCSEVDLLLSQEGRRLSELATQLLAGASLTLP